MGVSDSDAREMSLYDYEMRCWHWNDKHSDKSDEITDPEITQKMIDELRKHPEFLTKTKGVTPPPMPKRLGNA